MNPSLLTNLDLTMWYKIYDLFYENGFVRGNFSVLDAFPQDYNLVNVYPTVSIDANTLAGNPMQLGSPDIPNIQFILDVFANSDPQADDVSYMIWNELVDNMITIYDFNTGNPSTAASISYSGRPNLGTLSFERVNIRNVSPPIGTNITAENYHRIVQLFAKAIIY